MNVFKRNATTDQLKNQTFIPMTKPTLSSEKKKRFVGHDLFST